MGYKFGYRCPNCFRVHFDWEGVEPGEGVLSGDIRCRSCKVISPSDLVFEVNNKNKGRFKITKVGELIYADFCQD